MKKLNVLTRMLLLVALLVGSIGNAWGDSYTITFKTGSGDGTSASTSTACSTIVTSGSSSYLTGNLVTATSVYHSGGSGLKLGVSSGEGVIKMNLASSVTPTSIVVSAKRYNSSKSATLAVNGLTAQTLNTGTSFTNYTFTPTGEITYLQLNSSKYIWVESITVNYTPANTVKTPSITIPTSTPFVSTKTVSISCDTDDSTIYYTTDGSTPDTGSDEYTGSFSISATTTVKAIAVKDGMTNSEVASETFTKETVIDGISELISTLTNTNTDYYIKLTNAQVSYVYSVNGYLNDAVAGIYLFSTSPTLNTKYNGIYKIKAKTNNSLPQINSFESIDGEGTSEVAEPVIPIVMTATELETNFSSNISRPIRINNHTLNNDGNLTDNIIIYDTYIDESLTRNATYTLIGYPAVYNTGKRFFVTTAYPKPAAPTFDPIEGEFSDAFTLHLSCATDGATIYYTTNGDTPTTSSNVYDDATGIAIPNASTTVKAIAYYEDMTSDVASATYDYRVVARPQFSIADGTEVFYGETVTVTCATDGADIYYTTDSSTPSASSTKYTAPIAITDLTEIKVVAIKGSDESSVASATYDVKDPAAPTFSVAAGAVERNTVVTISSREGTSIVYTTNGNDADTGTDAGTNSVNVTITEGMTIKAICYDPLTNISPEFSASYTILKVATPFIDTAEGMLTKGTQVHITSATDGATIYYTLDGTTPTASSNIYNGYVVISGAHTLKAIAIKDNCIDSDVASAAYTVAGSGETTTMSERGYSNGDVVSTINGTDVSFTFAQNGGNNGPKYYDSGTSVRMYNKNKLTVTSSTKTIIGIVFTFNGNNTNLSLVAEQPGTFSKSGSVGTWSGSATSVQFINSTSNQAHIQTITVFFEGSSEGATVGDSRLAGFCSEHKVDFSTTGLKAYKAKVDEGNVVLTEITDGIVPANTGVILNGDADDYVIPFTDASATTDFADNQMVGVTQRTQVLWNPETDVYNYILQQGKFNMATDGYLKPNRAYLSTSYDVTTSGAKALSVVFAEDETDGIRSVGNTTEDSVRYNLAGQKVGADYKGIVIVNGKKYLRK